MHAPAEPMAAATNTAIGRIEKGTSVRVGAAEIQRLVPVICVDAEAEI